MSNEIKSVLGKEEKVIYKVISSIIVNSLMNHLPNENDKSEYNDVCILLTNKGSVIFTNEEDELLFYFKQGKDIKRFTYYKENEKVLININRLPCKLKKTGVFTPMSFITLKLSLSIEEFKFIENKMDIREGKEECIALNGIDISVKEGDFTCIMGPSGSGKSTLINVISTIDEVSRGKIFFKGKNLQSMKERELSKFRYENLGFIFQDFNLLDNLTVKENIAIPLILASKPKKEIIERVNAISSKLGITQLLNKYPAQCSGGQSQRIACARALVSNPRIIIADEPTGSLDTKNSHELLKMLKELNDEGITIIMVTHDNIIASYSKKLIFIRDGKVEAVLNRGEESQKEYFYKIVDITSKDSQNLIDML
ncbi:MAG: ABC transporter ATP-binding protein [Clostridium sp.]|nr:ABC transporter ATP-binding protein [Clostridium sp.]